MATPRDPQTATGRPLLIINPKAGGGLGEKRAARVIAAVATGLGEVDVRYTDAQGHASEIAREEALAGRGLLVAVGGDGTVSEIANGLLHAVAEGAPMPELGIVPRGTGGDFRRTLDLPLDVVEAASHIRERAARAVDAGRATYTTATGATETRHFVNVASFGFSSTVASRANESSKAFGPKAAYLGATIRTLVGYENQEIELQLDDAAPFRRTLLLGAVGNGRYFGGGMQICPEAALDSGKFSFVAVGDMGKLKVVRNLNRLFKGTHLALEEVASTPARLVRARPVAPGKIIPVELDGESPGRLPATFEVLPFALRIRY